MPMKSNSSLIGLTKVEKITKTHRQHTILVPLCQAEKVESSLGTIHLKGASAMRLLFYTVIGRIALYATFRSRRRVYKLQKHYFLERYMQTSDFALIRRTLDGDQNAFTTLVTKYQKWVHTLVWRKIGDFHIAEELTQDIFLKVYKKLSTLKPTDHFPGWLYVIASRHCIAWYRKKQLPTTSLDTMPTSELEELCYLQHASAHAEQISLERQREVVNHLLRKLPESERTVVTLHYLAEMSCEEISEFLGVSPNTVKSRLHRARKRLTNQEHLLRDASGIFQVPPTLIENVAREIARIKPVSSPVSKPWLPWGISFASAVLVILMMGFGTRALSRFQQPYNFNAASEMTVELIDAPVVLELARKPDALTRFGQTDTPGKNRGAGFQAEPLLIAAAQADETDLSTAKPQWIQTKGPGGVLRAGLFLTSDRTLYAITKTDLYRLTEEADTWTFVSASGPNREFDSVMAERGDTLYLLTPNELLASTDEGKTWNTLGARPEGHAVALVTTDTAIYLLLKTEVFRFRSKDADQPWEPIGETLRPLALQALADNKLEEVRPPNPAAWDFYAIRNMVFRIWDALAIDNTLFIGTSWGLFRFTDTWEKLPVPTLDGIKSLAAIEDRLYAGTIRAPGLAAPELGPEPSASPTVFASTNLGDSWTDITPISRGHFIRTAEVTTGGDTLILPGYGLRSQDGGKTWITLGGDLSRISVFPAIALDENNLYAGGTGIRRSQDGGLTWHPFTTGIVNSRVPNLFVFENVLYALTPTKMLKSADGGESWESVDLISANENASQPFLPPSLRKGLNAFTTKVATADGVLYVSNSEPDGVTLFRLSDAGDAFLPLEDAPDFEEDTLFMEWQKKRTEAVRNRSRVDEVMKQLNAAQGRIYEEQETNGTFTVADDTIFMEYRHKLYRWQFDETAWHDTGLEDHAEVSPIGRKGLALAVSGNTVYAGKREGELFLSQDGGDTWNNITQDLAFPFGHFKEIVFAGPTVYVSTDKGVMRSSNSETWDVLTDAEGNRLIMDQIAVDGTTVYGVRDSGIYQVDHQTNIGEQIIPELPHTAISFAVDGDTFYIGTKQNGVLRFQRDSR